MSTDPSRYPVPIELLPRRIEAIKPKDVIQPLQELILRPDAAWLSIKARQENVRVLFERYVFFLAAIPASCGFIGYCLFDSYPLGRSLIVAISGYVLSLFLVFAAILIASATAPLFRAHLPLNQSAQLVIYSFMPFFLSGVMLILPPLRPLSMLGVASVWLFYKGLEPMGAMRGRQQLTYFMLNAVAWVMLADASLNLLRL